MRTTKRRQAGEGGISEYLTKAGPRFLIKYPVQQEDGTKRVVLKRGFTTRRQAAAALRADIRRTETGEWVHPSKQPLAAYLAEWLDGQRLAPATLASYRKNVRLHVAPRLGATAMDRLTGTAVDAWMRTLEASGRADGRGGLSPRTVRYVYTILRSALADAVKHGRLAGCESHRPVHPAQPVPGTPTGDARLDRTGTGPVPPLGRRARLRHRHGLAAPRVHRDASR
jgi:hypothetical protein